MTVPEENVYARDLAWRLFRDAADEDYLISRWCSCVSMHYPHYWHAQQAIEKYLKCHLVLNDVDVRKCSHDLNKLWALAVEECGDLLPMLLCPPWYFEEINGVRHRGFEPACAFVARINEAGSPDQRYRYFSNVTHRYDVHKLDEIVFFLRRVCFPLDMKFGRTQKTFREALTDQRSWQPHPSFTFEKENWKIGLEDRQKYFRIRNFAFFEDDALNEGKVNSSWSAINSPISMNLKRSGSGKEALSWFLTRAFFKKEVRELLQQELASKDPEQP